MTAQISFYASNKKQTSPWFLQCVSRIHLAVVSTSLRHSLVPGRGNRSSQKADAGALIARPVIVFTLDLFTLPSQTSRHSRHLSFFSAVVYTGHVYHIW